MNFEGQKTDNLETIPLAGVKNSEWESPETSVLVLFLRTFLAVVAILGNAVFLFVFLRVRHFRRQFSNVLITLLALADFISGVATLIKTWDFMYRDADERPGYDRFQCVLSGAIKVVAMFWSHIMFISIAADRLMAVKMMMKYSLLKFRPRLLIIFISWVVAAVYVCGFLFGTLPEGRSVSCAISLAASPIFNTTYVLGAIFMGLVLIAVYVYALYSLKRVTSNCRQSPARQKSQQNVFKSVSILIFFNFLLCVLPMMLGLVATLSKLSKDFLGISGILVGWGAEINSCVGIFIYYLKHEEFKKCVKMVFLSERSVLSSDTPVVVPPTAADKLQRPTNIPNISPVVTS